MAHLRKSLKGAVGAPEDDESGMMRHQERRRKETTPSKHKSNIRKSKTNKIIKSVAIGIVCAAILQLLFVSFLLSEDTDEWNASEAFTKTRSFGGGRGGNDDATKLDNIFEDITHDIDGSVQYEPKMKLNAFGYVYWHLDPGEGVIN